jgi:hypothetical protein
MALVAHLCSVGLAQGLYTSGIIQVDAWTPSITPVAILPGSDSLRRDVAAAIARVKPIITAISSANRPHGNSGCIVNTSSSSTGATGSLFTAATRFMSSEASKITMAKRPAAMIRP